MKKGRIGKRIFIFILAAVIILATQGIAVLATEQTDEEPEGGEDSSGEPFTVPADCIVNGQNPEGAIVNLFDYWQYDDPHKKGKEEAHDYYESISDGGSDDITYTYTYNLGISQNHLLRFGYRDTGGTCTICLNPELEEKGEWWNNWTDEEISALYYGQGFYGDWNEYNIDKTKTYGGLRTGIVENLLDDNGFPKLNLGGTGADFFGDYWKDENFADNYGSKTNESLAYLFKVENTEFKASYPNVQGLFQLNDEGYYYYDSTKNFAELSDNGKEIILYNSPGVGKVKGVGGTDDSEANFGQFFPFNKAGDVFDTVENDPATGKPKLTYKGTGHTSDNDDLKAVTDGNGNSYIQCFAPDLNHYLGMTLEVPFLQPVDGEVALNTPMVFEFSGDDDVWIFIDDVLVADLGGIHDAYYLKIDFHTGNVYICKDSARRNTEPTTADHTLYQSFEKAQVNDVAFVGETFADNTVHTLKMFYLERGNIASNLSLNFNLQIARYNQLKKVDQDGNPIKDVEFELYGAKECSSNDPDAILCAISAKTGMNVPFYVKQNNSNILTTLKTDKEGIADFTDYSFGSNDWKYYILREKKAPDGYSPPRDIVLEYNPNTKVLTVANRWETGSYASFTSYVNEKVNTPIYYAQYNNATGEIQAIKSNDQTVDKTSREKGLVLAVPMLKNQNNEWLPLYGSNVEGFNTIRPENPDSGSMKKALLKAALLQAELNESGEGKAWYLKWDDKTKGLAGNLSDLPGRADRYRLLNNDNADMQMAYIIIKPDVFAGMGVSGSSDDRYDALKTYVTGNGVDTAVNAIYGNVELLDTSDFMRVFRSLLYIPNVQRELRVKKVDESGKGIAGAEFTIYTDKECTDKVVTGTTADVEGENGILIFKPGVRSSDGYAPIEWKKETYYLKETKAPKGYMVNDTVIPIKVDDHSVYADAGEPDDGVSVEAGVGHLYQTMTKYASDSEVNVTLHNIIVAEQKKSSGEFDKEEWNKSGEACRLSYNNTGKNYLDANGINPFFSTDTGFLSICVNQGEKPSGSAIWDDLNGIDLTGLFSQLNVVVVKDQPIVNGQKESRELRVQKVNENLEPLNGAEFGLYDEKDVLAASGKTGLVDGQNGVLVFRVKQDGEQSEDGFALLAEWKAGNYYLKEIAPPSGYQLNDRKIPVVVEESAVYADAGTADNGVSVRAGVGRYLKKDDKNAVPPEKITVSAQKQASGSFGQNAWEKRGDFGSKDLLYKNYPEMGMDYGLIDGDSETTPFFETDTGFIRNDVVSGGKNITGQFSQLNIVVVKDRKIENPEEPENPGNPESPGNPETPGNPENPENPKNPENPENPENPKNPENPGNSEKPGDDSRDPDKETGSSDTNTDTDEGIDSGKDAKKNEDAGVFQTFNTLFDRVESIGTGIPQTGDDSLIWWWASLSGTSLLGIGATTYNLFLVKRKSKKSLSKRKQKKRSAKRKRKKIK